MSETKYPAQEVPVYFEDIHHGFDARKKYIYAHVRDAKTGELLISATIDYCLDAIKERNWFLVGGKI